MVLSERAPEPVGPYSQAVESEGLVYISGQIGLDPETGNLVQGGAAGQAEMAVRNLISVLGAAGAGLEDVVRIGLYLSNIDDFAAVNEIYSKFFSSWKPARTTLGGLKLPKGALVEIDAVARVDE